MMPSALCLVWCRCPLPRCLRLQLQGPWPLLSLLLSTPLLVQRFKHWCALVQAACNRASVGSPVGDTAPRPAWPAR